MSVATRTYNSAKNVSLTFGIQAISILFSFIARTIFIHALNVDYLGINGLFTNVLSILSFSELGISGAIIYNMYKPVADNDLQKVSALLNFYRKAYHIVAFVILAIGLCLTPFIEDLINGSPDINENLYIIYILFLLNTVASYLYSFNRSIFTVYQKEYVNVLIERLFWILISITQLIYLWIARDYYGYLIFQLIATLGGDILISLYAKKKYPIILSNKESKLNKNEIKTIFKDITSIFAYKIGCIILHSTSNIIIARLINIVTVGICSNYLLIISSIETILQKGFNGIVASIGNLNAVSDRVNKRKVFYELTLFSNWIYGVISIMLFVGINEVIRLWIGTEYILKDVYTVGAIVLSIFILGINFSSSNFRLTMGFFRQAQFVPLCAAVLNLGLSIYLGLRWGLFGIYISISISRILTFNLVDPWLVLKKGLGYSVFPFYLYQSGFIIISVINAGLCYYTIQNISISGFWGSTIKLLVAFIMANIVYLMSYGFTSSYNNLKIRLISLFSKTL